MNVLNYKKRGNSSLRTRRKHKMYRKEIPKQDCLEDFIGKFKAESRINGVNLKQDFKKGVL